MFIKGMYVLIMSQNSDIRVSPFTAHTDAI